MKKVFLIFVFCFANLSFSQIKILFDATKAQMAGNADWIVDADLNNITFSGGPASIGGSESNPQRFPTPSQTGITPTTSETFWNGGISAWAVDCAKLGYIVETLPYDAQITYGNASNSQDLSNYKVYVIDEPNIAYTASEKDAIINFVKNGGGLFMVSDHDVSDRNNDGIDSPSIFNDLMSNNTVQPNAFGIAFDLATFSQTTTNIPVFASHPILKGSFGNVTSLKFSAGTTMTLNTISNTTVQGLIFKTGSLNTGTSNVMFAQANFQTGKVVALGDSSPPDDGTGDINDQLYFGYTDLSGSHRNLIMNATKWLATPSQLSIESNYNDKLLFSISPNPVQNDLKISYFSTNENPVIVSILDSLGRKIKEIEFSDSFEGETRKSIPLNQINSGMYFCKISINNQSNTLRFIVN